MKRMLSLMTVSLLLLLTGTLAACTASGTPSDSGTTPSSPTEAPTEEMTEAPTEAPTDAPADAPTEAPTEADTEPETLPDNARQLIPDILFESGMEQISQKDHKNHDRFTTLKTHSFYGTDAPAPRWRLAQWDSGPCMVENEVDEGPTVITDGQYRTFGYDPAADVMTFRLDTSLYYQGRPAKNGDYWPHLLIEQGDFGYKSLSADEKKYYSCDADRIILSMDIRLDDYSITPIDGDWVDAAQFLLYFYVKGIDTNDFCWFGVQLFDNRWARNQNYIGYDGGKADASGAMIFSIGSMFVYPDRQLGIWYRNKPNVGGDWYHIELDIKPFLEQMLKAGQADGYFKAKSLSELCINGMNLGWETIGTFDHTMQVRGLRLVSYLDE